MVSFLNLSMFKVKPTHDRLLLSMLGKGAYCDTVSGPSREEDKPLSPLIIKNPSYTFQTSKLVS